MQSLRIGGNIEASGSGQPFKRRHLGVMKGETLNSSPQDLKRLIDGLLDPHWEPGFDDYSEHLAVITRILIESGAEVEGNLFAPDMPITLLGQPWDGFRLKRRNFSLFCAGGSSLLEIGFNAGHSCMLALTINKDLTYTGVDDGRHPYTKPCFEYLRSVFGDRVRLHLGDSREVMPVLATNPIKYDLFHLDGGHGFNTAHVDLCNILKFRGDQANLLVDDTSDAHIDSICDYYVMLGHLKRIEFKRLWADIIDQRLFRINLD